VGESGEPGLGGWALERTERGVYVLGEYLGECLFVSSAESKQADVCMSHSGYALGGAFPDGVDNYFSGIMFTHYSLSVPDRRVKDEGKRRGWRGLCAAWVGDRMVAWWIWLRRKRG
jgi:hypothetical protein